MADSDDSSEKPNGVVADEEIQNDDSSNIKRADREELTLSCVLRRLVTDICFPDQNSSSGASATPIKRIRASLSENVPLLSEASQNTGRDVLGWTRRGGPFRALFVVSVGTITLLALTGVLVFMLFFLAATVNAIVISFLMSLAAAGGFLAFFFACTTAIYIGALSVAVFVISAVTVSAIIAVLIAAGWIGFFCTVWLATKKSVDLAKHFGNTAGSAYSAYSSTRRARRNHEPVKSD